MSTTLACPHCGSMYLGTLERILGVAGATIERDDAGKLDFDYDGHTEVLWDTSTTIGWNCADCGHTHEGTEEDPGFDLLVPYQSDDDEDDEDDDE